MKKLLLTTLLFAISILCKAQGKDYFNGFENTRISFEYNFGNFISIDKDYAEIDLFMPFTLHNWITILDVHTYYFKNNKWGASGGVGIRKYIGDKSLIGTNLFYDYLEGWKTRDNFHRIGIGLEWLKGCWDFRVNGYFPIDKKIHSSNFISFELGDTYSATSEKLEFAYTGFDAEIGISIYERRNFNLYVAAGPYYFYRTHFEHFFGGYGRLKLDWKSIISLEGRISYDHVYKTNIQGIIRISIPFDFLYFRSKSQCECNWSSTQPIYRNGVILRSSCCNWTWNWDDKN